MLALLILSACFGITTKPNVLFIVSDDLRPTLGVYGIQALTLTLDALANRGLTCTRVFSRDSRGAPRLATLHVWAPPRHDASVDSRVCSRCRSVMRTRDCLQAMLLRRRVCRKDLPWPKLHSRLKALLRHDAGVTRMRHATTACSSPRMGITPRGAGPSTRSPLIGSAQTAAHAPR